MLRTCWVLETTRQLRYFQILAHNVFFFLCYRWPRQSSKVFPARMTCSEETSQWSWIFSDKSYKSTTETVKTFSVWQETFTTFRTLYWHLSKHGRSWQTLTKDIGFQQIFWELLTTLVFFSCRITSCLHQQKLKPTLASNIWKWFWTQLVLRDPSLAAMILNRSGLNISNPRSHYHFKLVPCRFTLTF